MKKMKSGAQAFPLKEANQSSPLAFEGSPNKVPSIAKLDEFTLQTVSSSGSDKKEQQKVIESSVAKKGDKKNLLDFVTRTASTTSHPTKRLPDTAQHYHPKPPNPDTPLTTNP